MGSIPACEDYCLRNKSFKPLLLGGVAVNRDGSKAQWRICKGRQFLITTLEQNFKGTGWKTDWHAGIWTRYLAHTFFAINRVTFSLKLATLSLDFACHHQAPRDISRLFLKLPGELWIIVPWFSPFCTFGMWNRNPRIENRFGRIVRVKKALTHAVKCDGDSHSYSWAQQCFCKAYKAEETTALLEVIIVHYTANQIISVYCKVRANFYQCSTFSGFCST